MKNRGDQIKYIEGLFPEVQKIEDADIRQMVIDCWLVALEDSQWNNVEDMPWVPGKAEFITNVQHVREVAQIAIAMVGSLSASPVVTPGTVNLDIVIAGCLLHDVGKLIEYTGPSNHSGELTTLGRHMMHHILGAHLAIKAGVSAEIVHCIEAHREPESYDRSLEATIVRLADICHALAMLHVHPEATFR